MINQDTFYNQEDKPQKMGTNIHSFCIFYQHSGMIYQEDVLHYNGCTQVFSFLFFYTFFIWLALNISDRAVTVISVVNTSIRTVCPAPERFFWVTITIMKSTLFSYSSSKIFSNNRKPKVLFTKFSLYLLILNEETLFNQDSLLHFILG